jgi:AcrR family transcriptional regulator
LAFSDWNSGDPRADSEKADFILTQELTGKAATQERILQAAIQLFLEQGYEGTTVAEVAEKAAVSRATVFWHFSEKGALFRESFTRLIEPFRESLERRFDEGPPAQRLQEQIALYRSFTSEYRQALEGFVRWALEAGDFREWLISTLLDLHQRYLGVLTETLSELLPEGSDPRALAAGLIVLLDGDMILSWFDASGQRAEERSGAIQAWASLLEQQADPRA